MLLLLLQVYTGSPTNIKLLYFKLNNNIVVTVDVL